MTPPKIDQFVPLLATLPSADRREFQITVIPQGQQPQSFQSLHSGAGSAGGSKKNCEPSLSVQRENGRITRITVQCSCGQTIDLDCVYDEAIKPADTLKPDEPPKPKAASKPAETSKGQAKAAARK